MKFRAKENVNVRSGPSAESAKVSMVPKGDIVESDEYSWKAVTLPNGTKGFCAAEFLEPVAQAASAGAWTMPVPPESVRISQKFFEPNPRYKITKRHPGVDYSTQGKPDVPVLYCADGEVIETGRHAAFGNYFFYYVPAADRTFAYFHLRDAAPAKGAYRSGERCDTAGNTGDSSGIHLHLECMRGRRTSVERGMLYNSAGALLAAAEDADAFIRSRL